MISNHQLSHNEEVKGFTQYDHWKLKINNETAIEVSTKELLTIVEGSNMDISIAGNTVTLNALNTLYEKVNKVISSSTYTITESDKYKWLVFTNDCTVTIPTGLDTPNLFEGESDGATVTFQAATGVTLRHINSISKTLSADGVFGIRFRSADNCVLYGTDPTNYLG
jgi:hypothetical protein